MTLFEIIDRYEARRGSILQTTLTPRGQAVQQVLHLRRLLAQLPPADRADIAAMLREEVSVPTVAS
jgi:hypothetical protein